jgi:hypothetical protein
MIKGNAKLIISEATVIAALQEYFSNRVHDGDEFTVKSVTIDYSGADKAFELEVSEVTS